MKRFKFPLMVIALVLAAASASAQEKADSSDAVKTVLVRLFEFSNQQTLQSAEARSLLMGEALDWKMPTFGELAAAPDKVVLLDAENAVGRIQLHGKNRVVDVY